MPSNRDKALRGRSARSVLRDLMGPISAKPKVLATRLTSETYGEGVRVKRQGKLQTQALGSSRWAGHFFFTSPGTARPVFLEP